MVDFLSIDPFHDSICDAMTEEITGPYILSVQDITLVVQFQSQSYSAVRPRAGRHFSGDLSQPGPTFHALFPPARSLGFWAVPLLKVGKTRRTGIQVLGLLCPNTSKSQLGD